jgi:hypothetical protein
MILLIDIDSVIPNLALKKVEMFYGKENCVWNKPERAEEAEKIYVSCVFTKNKEEAEKWEKYGEKCFIGGSGYSFDVKLPPEIDAMKPKINWGFTTRGCIRNCFFCFVPKMEGKIKIVGDIYDIWDGMSKEITIMDNNILALPEHFKMICSQIRKEKLKVDFNQGLDCRLLTDDIIKELKSIKHVEYRFSWDNDYDMTELFQNIKNNLGRGLIFVYVKEKTTCDDYWVWFRLNQLKKIGHRPYLMRDINADKKWNRVAQWVNQFWTFQKFDYETFCVAQDNNRKNYALKKKKLKELK